MSLKALSIADLRGVCFALAWLACAPCFAADSVYLVPLGGAQARQKLSGTIKDYTGRELVIDLNGVEKRYPSEQVAEIESEWTPAQQAADELFAQRDYTAALAKYEQAVRSETRRWQRRRIVAQMIWCLRNTNQYARAGDLFLALARDDASLLDFACIPIAWIPASPSPDVEKKSRQWLTSETPAAVLIGASHLLSTGERATAVRRLEQLASDADPRVAALARALVWQATYMSATPAQLAAWSAEIEQFPSGVRAGPYFVLGKAHAQHKQFDDAALNMLRVPLLYPQDRPLSALAYFEAARALEQAGSVAAAARIYRELIADDPQSRPAAEAKLRLQVIDKGGQEKVGG